MAEATSFFDHYQNNKTEIARIYKDKYDKDALETKLRDRERARMVEHDRLKLVNEQQAKKAAKRAAIKAESDAAWSNVSDQLKQRAREADQKADCVWGRTYYRLACYPICDIKLRVKCLQMTMLGLIVL